MLFLIFFIKYSRLTAKILPFFLSLAGIFGFCFFLWPEFGFSFPFFLPFYPCVLSSKKKAGALFFGRPLFSYKKLLVVAAAAAVPVANQAQNALQDGQSNHDVYPLTDKAKGRAAQVVAPGSTKRRTAAVVAPGSTAAVIIAPGISTAATRIIEHIFFLLFCWYIYIYVIFGDLVSK